MGDVLVTQGKVAEGRITELSVDFHGLPSRTVDRDTVLSWLRDGHSLVPLQSGTRGIPLQLVEVGDEHFIRADNATEASDTLPEGL